MELQGECGTGGDDEADGLGSTGWATEEEEAGMGKFLTLHPPLVTSLNSRVEGIHRAYPSSMSPPDAVECMTHTTV